MKKIVYIILVIISVLLIYFGFSHQKCNYVSISDEMSTNLKYNYNYFIEKYLSKKNMLSFFYNYKKNTILDLINDIKNNHTIKKDNIDYYFKKVLRESDIVVINIGMNSIGNNYNPFDINKNFYYFDNLYNDIEKLIIEIKKYAQGTIIFFGYYNPTNYYDAKTDEFFFNIDNRLNNMLSKYSVIYIDLYDLVKRNQYKTNNSYLLNQYGHKEIANIIEYYLE